MAKADVISDLAAMRPDEFVSKYLFETPPHAVPDVDSFSSWRSSLCGNLGVNAADAFMVGSGAIGVSLNPNKNFKDFDEYSDIDMAVVSSRYFGLAWRYLRTNGKLRHRLMAQQRIAWDSHEKGLVFWGAIEADKLLPIFPFGKDWVPALVTASTEVVGNREVKVRIYNDLESLKSYQVMGVRRLRNSILEKEKV